MQQCIKILFIFIWNSICFGRHTAHHQEPKTALTACDFAYWYVECCWTCSCWTLSGRVYSAWQRPATMSTRPTTFHLWKTKGCWCNFRLLMMGGVSLETCWTLYKYEIKFWYIVSSCWIFYTNLLNFFFFNFLEHFNGRKVRLKWTEGQEGNLASCACDIVCTNVFFKSCLISL
jgi:hypothetical protein